jgi:hypothetical protein
VEDYLVYIMPCACTAAATATTDPLFTSWFRTNSGQYAVVVTNDGGTPTNMWGTMTSRVYADVQKIQYSSEFVFVTASGLASYVMGPWYVDPLHKTLFPNLPYDQNLTGLFRRDPQPAEVPFNTPLEEIGFYVNGSAMYNMMDGYAWDGTEDNPAAEGEGVWHRDAWFAESVSFDPGNFHSTDVNQYHAQRQSHRSPVPTRGQCLHIHPAKWHSDVFRGHDRAPSLANHRLGVRRTSAVWTLRLL